jgi:hypothetical protein
MPFKIFIDKVPVDCESAADAIALATLMAKGGGASNGSHKTHSKGKPGRPPDPAKQREREEKARTKRLIAQTFLQTISIAGDVGGATTESLKKALRLKSLRSLGGVSVGVKGFLEAEKCDPNEVFTVIKINGEKRWKPGVEMGKALEALANKNGGAQ